jgi:predicted dehydrogenase
MKPVTVGCVGCGNISGQYLAMGKSFPNVRIVACADLDRSRAEAAAHSHGIGRVLSTEALLADPDIEIVLNLTIPKAHVPVSLAALGAGKHVYVEKPLGIDRDEAAGLVSKAREKNLRVGCAPDTFMGAGIQTCRKLIDDGVLGDITAFTAAMISRGHEHWHPAPEFYYQAGGGPMLDMGPYYLTALLQLLGPIRRVTGFTSVAIPHRTITSQPLAGRTISVETPDHYMGVLEFESGVVGSIIQSFAMRNADVDGDHPIVVYGTKATLKVPDPNGFDGIPRIRHEGGDGAWHDVPHAFVAGYGRSVGLADLAAAISKGRPHRCSLEQAFCVLDVMQGFREAGESGQAHRVAVPYHRPAPMPSGLPFGALD